MVGMAVAVVFRQKTYPVPQPNALPLSDYVIFTVIGFLIPAVLLALIGVVMLRNSVRKDIASDSDHERVPPGTAGRCGYRQITLYQYHSRIDSDL